jgi:hypothetical protein
MPAPLITSNHHRALTLLADARDGVTEAAMLARGFTAALLTELVTAGLASAASENATSDAARGCGSPKWGGGCCDSYRTPPFPANVDRGRAPGIIRRAQRPQSSSALQASRCRFCTGPTELPL